jgi:hypothetical protein
MMVHIYVVLPSIRRTNESEIELHLSVSTSDPASDYHLCIPQILSLGAQAALGRYVLTHQFHISPNQSRSRLAR